jgi:protein SCO1/2
MRLALVLLLLATQLPGARPGTMKVTRYAGGRIASAGFYRGAVKVGTHTAWWPDGTLRAVAQYSADAYDGVYETWYPSGARYELRTFARGHESGRQQAWAANGSLYLNYEVRDGRRYGLVNARPCLTTTASGSDLPYYVGADFTPAWTPSPARALQIDLTSQRGRRVTGADLAGRPYVASFLFTRCTTVCPGLVRQLARVQEATTIRLVSYSVTPAIDTPSVLDAFGKAHGVDADRWLLLTGDATRIYAAARQFYFADDGRVDGDDTFLHTEKVLLVDGEGRLRGVYNGTLAHDVDRLIADAAALDIATR